MLKKLNIKTLMKAIQETVENNTEYRCYDIPPKDEQPPFYYAELIQVRPSNSKTMWREIYVINFHAIASGEKSSIPIYKLIDDLEEALTEEIALPEPFFVVIQSAQGLQVINNEETKDKHAIVQYNFDVCYGFKTK